MIRLENVSKYYYNSSNVSCALRKINLNFKMGEFVAVTGESGSGKTTLLNIISGFDSYEDGEIYVNGKPTSYFDEEDFENYRKNEISFIFQNYNLIESYSVIENVMVTYIIAGVPYDTAKEKALEILKKVGLDGDVNKKTTKLSGGQKQRLAIARALAKETNIIVADEPT
ncbi:MAG: ABC transporter ATP-binding protein [Bacilli bacterium]|nr:ABC transporter ATP-binding protein [Bacilli bacterium]